MSRYEEPMFYAYVEDMDKAEALVDAVSALYTPLPDHWQPPPEYKIAIGTRGGSSVSREGCSLEEMIELIRRHFTPSSYASVTVTTQMPSRIFPTPHFAAPDLWWESSEFGESRPPGEYFNGVGLTGCEIHNRAATANVAPVHENCPIPVGAVIQMHQTRQDMEFILQCLCSSPRVKTGGMSNVDIACRADWLDWSAPLELSATYNADHHVARDVALSWLYLHNGLRVDYRIAGLPLDELAARVEAAPKGTHIGLVRNSKVVVDHFAAPHDRSEWTTRPIELWRYGPREIFPEDELLSREQVLAILQTPREALLGALETAAVKPDPIWLEAERRVLEVIEAAKNVTEEEKVEIDVDTLEHRYFLGQYAPYHVQRLEKGGVMMTTHPYRTLWPLWSDALRLLGIRP